VPGNLVGDSSAIKADGNQPRPPFFALQRELGLLIKSYITSCITLIILIARPGFAPLTFGFSDRRSKSTFNRDHSNKYGDKLTRFASQLSCDRAGSLSVKYFAGPVIRTATCSKNCDEGSFSRYVAQICSYCSTQAFLSTPPRRSEGNLSHRLNLS